MVVGSLSGDRPDDAGYLCLACRATVSLAVIVLSFGAFDISIYNHQAKVKATSQLLPPKHSRTQSNIPSTKKYLPHSRTINIKMSFTTRRSRRVAGLSPAAASSDAFPVAATPAAKATGFRKTANRSVSRTPVSNDPLLSLITHTKYSSSPLRRRSARPIDCGKTPMRHHSETRRTITTQPQRSVPVWLPNSTQLKRQKPSSSVSLRT